MTYLAYKSAARQTTPPPPPVIRRKVLTVVKPEERVTFPLAKIVNAVSQAAWIDSADILGPWREKNIMRARMAAYYLCRTYSKASFPRIGQFIGGRDHTTVLYGYNKVKNAPDDFLNIIQGAEMILFPPSLRSDCT